MQELINREWQLDSAVEAEIIGRVAIFGNDEVEGTKFIFKHSEETDATGDEVEFLRREQKYGKLVIGRQYAESAEVGLQAVVDTNETFNGITPDIASICLRAINRSREISAHRLDPARDRSDIRVAA